jgi:hypothetical protein
VTESESQRVVRPTLRCLIDDLGQEVGPPDLRAALRTATDDMARDATYLLPCVLTEADHLVLDKANLIATDDAANRERIETITDRFAIKVKTSDRRAALWLDEAGVWWLLAAGRRKDDGPGDFYRELERLAGDSIPIAPTAADARYLKLEAAYAAECESERAAHGLVLGALLAAASAPGTQAEVTVFGASVSISIVPDDDGLAVLELSWEFVQFDDQDRFPMDVLAMVPGKDNLDLWDYLPPRKDTDSPHAWFTYVPQEWVDHLATTAELDDLLATVEAWLPPNPSSDGSEHFSHRARASVVMLAYVTGIEIVGLCGARVVAHRDYEKFPVCPKCEESLALLRQLGRPEAQA